MPEAFKCAALLAFAAKFDLTDDILSRDRDLLHYLGSLDLVLGHHSAIHRAAGLNPERIHRLLSNDPRVNHHLTMVTRGGEVETDPNFVAFHHSGPLRSLQQRLFPVYRYHANRM